MKKLLHHFKNFHFVLLLLALSGNMNGQTYTVTGNVNSSTLACSTFTGYNVISIGNGSTASSLIMNDDLNLTLSGCSDNPLQIIVDKGTIDFSTANKRLYLPEGSSISFLNGGTLNPSGGNGGGCTGNDRIYIGGIILATCQGGAGIVSFEDIIAFEGSGSTTSNSPVCVGNTINLSATPPPNGGPFIYTWYEPSVSTTTSIGTGQSISIASATSGPHIYQVKMYSASLNKTMIANATVVVNSASAPAAPTITASGPTTFCSGENVTLTSSTGSGYLWSTGATTQSISPTTSGSYTVQVTNASGCSSNSSVATVVTVRSLVNNVTNGFSGSSFCTGAQAAITFDANNLSGVYPYTLVYRNNTTNATASVIIANDDATAFNVVPNPIVTTDYTLLSITDSNGCVRTTGFVDSTARVTINALPTTPTIGTPIQPTCSVATGSVALSGLPSSGTWTLTRSGTSSASTTGTGTSTTISGLATGTYNFTVSDGTCTSLASADVIINAKPGTPGIPIIDSYTLPIFGSDGTVTLKNLPSGNWELNQIKDGVTTTISGSGSSYTLTNLSNGSYEFEVSEVCTSARSNSLILVYYMPIVNSAAANCNGFVASWSAVPTATKYLLDVSTVNDFSSFVGVYHDFDVGNVLSHTLTGLQTGGALYYRVRAMNLTKITLYSATITVSPLVTNTYSGTWDNGMPTSNQNIVFNSAFSSTGDIEACNCTVTNNGNVTFNSGHTLKITNWLHINGGSLTFENAASLVQINNVANTGNIKYVRTTNTAVLSTDYTYWSSPVSPQTIGNFSPKTQEGMMYSYDSSIDDWKQEYLSTSMVAGLGYIVRGPEPSAVPTPPSPYMATFVGVPHNGDYSIPAIADKSYLLGNPYPSALDADTFLAANANVLNGTLYFWTHNTGIGTNVSNPGTGVYAYSGDDYATYNATGGVGAAPPDSDSTTGSAPSDPGHPVPPSLVDNGKIPTGKIAAGQGFFASTKTSISGSSIVYNNNMRVGVGGITGTNSQFFKTRNPKEKTTSTIQKNRVWLNLTNTQGAFKQTLVGYITDATNDYDSRFDGESFDGNEFVDFYSINEDKNLAIQGRALPFDENDEVPLGFRTKINGTFSINIDQVDGLLANQQVFIEDKLTSTLSDLKSGSYTFTTAPGTFNDRFVLRYKENTSDKILSVDETKANDGIIVLYSNNYKTLIIRNNLSDAIVNSVTLFNMLGQKITHWDIKERDQTSIQIPIKNVIPEIYIVKVKTTEGETSKRIIIR